MSEGEAGNPGAIAAAERHGFVALPDNVGIWPIAGVKCVTVMRFCFIHSARSS